MSVPRSNAVFEVCPGDEGTLFVMPDRSLWGWGTDTKNPERLPELLDDHHVWARVSNRSGDWMPQEANGTVWETGTWSSANLTALSVTNQDWVDLTGGVAYALALQRDGTLLGWELSGSRNGQRGPMTEVQTNFLWRAISAFGPRCLGVSSDGRLWSWNRRGFSPLTFSPPTQESTSTNWIGVAEGRYAWSSSGELWGAPMDQLHSSNAIKERFALGSIVHEIRSDGTLWAFGERRQITRRFVSRVVASSFSSTGYALSGNATTQNSRNSQWRRIGERSDWVSIWGSDETYFGLTSDGTVWVWGIDWGQKPIATLKDRLNYLWERLRDHLQPTAAAGGGMAGPQKLPLTQPYQGEPRPLMRFKQVNK
jgi:hypothetical protein